MHIALNWNWPETTEHFQTWNQTLWLFEHIREYSQHGFQLLSNFVFRRIFSYNGLQTILVLRAEVVFCLLQFPG